MRIHTDEELERAIKGLSAMGRLIEGGWEAYRLKLIPVDAGVVQVRECRLAFYAGAAHLFYGILTALDAGEVDDAGDLNKMKLIDLELRSFQWQMKKKVEEERGS
jgi:hypothetical protein